MDLYVSIENAKEYCWVMNRIDYIEASNGSS